MAFSKMITFEVQTGILTYNKNGKTARLKVNPDEVLEIINQGAAFSTELLPAGTRYFKRTGNRYALALEFPPHKREIKFYGRESIKDVPLPGGLFLANVNYTNKHFRLNSYNLFAFAGKQITDGTEKLYRFPTPNLDTGGYICWGSSLKTFDFPKLNGLSDFIRIFLGSEFNDHMTETKMLNDKFDWSGINPIIGAYQYFSKLAELGEIKPEWFSTANDVVNTVDKAIKYNLNW